MINVIIGYIIKYFIFPNRSPRTINKLDNYILFSTTTVTMIETIAGKNIIRFESTGYSFKPSDPPNMYKKSPVPNVKIKVIIKKYLSDSLYESCFKFHLLCNPFHFLVFYRINDVRYFTVFLKRNVRKNHHLYSHKSLLPHTLANGRSHDLAS